MPQVPQRLLNLVIKYFRSRDKARLWFDIPNPVLNGVKPKDYHQNGKYHLLEKLIISALEENKNGSDNSNRTT